MRQVHLIHSELFVELEQAGFNINPDELGENVTTKNIELLNLPKGTRLRIGKNTILEVTGLRNPCKQLDKFQSGLTAQLIFQNDRGSLVRKAGIMSIVLKGGEIFPGDAIEVDLPPPPHQMLERV